MIMVYYDEAGDDGFPEFSSPLFALSCLYTHYQNWQEIFKQVRAMRMYLNAQYRFPANMELHTREFLLNKRPYAQALRFDDDVRVAIINDFVQFLPNIDIRFINVVINKIAINRPPYNVLDRALTYSLQRIETDLNELDPASKFLVITDPGRIGKMRKTARRMQKFNYIPSKFGPSAYRQEIKRLIEDPLPKESDQSYFIQIADLMSFIVYHYKRIQLKIGEFPKRLPPAITPDRITQWMETIKPRLNLKATGRDPFGVVCYPR